MPIFRRLSLLALIAVAATVAATAADWAQPRVSVALLRATTSHAAEQVSQVVMGTPLQVTERKGEWWRVETPEGYSGYVRSNTLVAADDDRMTRWRKSHRAIVHSDRTEYITATPEISGERVSDVVPGCILEVEGDAVGEMIPVRIPDGRSGFISPEVLMPLEEWAAQRFVPAEMPLYAARMMGVPYVWGGTSVNGMDCSGLTQIAAYRQGVMIKRDADEQVADGIKINKSDYSLFLPGDLLFFGNTRTGRITHVAISIGGPSYIHQSARVRRSSLDPDAADYENPGLIAVRRIDPETAERLALRNHPWYF